MDPFTVNVPDDNVLDTAHVPRIDSGPLMPAHAVRAPDNVPPASGRAAFALSYAVFTAVALAATLDEVVEMESVMHVSNPGAERFPVIVPPDFGKAAFAKS